MWVDVVFQQEYSSRPSEGIPTPAILLLTELTYSNESKLLELLAQPVWETAVR